MRVSEVQYWSGLGAEGAVDQSGAGFGRDFANSDVHQTCMHADADAISHTTTIQTRASAVSTHTHTHTSMLVCRN